MLLAEIGDERRMECHLAEVDRDTTLTGIIDWLKSRDAHLEEELRGRWTFARIYILGGDDPRSFSNREHVITVYAKENRRLVFTGRR